MRSLLFPLALTLAVTCLTAASGDDKKTDNKVLSNQEFVTAASAAGLAEVNLSRLALERTQNSEVKAFAQHMLKDHTKANTELLQIADSKKLTPAPKMDPKHEMLATQLAGLRGDAFDRAYVKAMVDDHAAALVLFEAAHLTTPDPDLKAFATKLLPELKEHDVEAKGLWKQINKDATPAATKDK